jgi:hypothetical protein
MGLSSVLIVMKHAQTRFGRTVADWPSILWWRETPLVFAANPGLAILK